MSHTPDDPSFLRPGQLPICFDPDREPSQDYPGFTPDEVPTFDEQDDPSLLTERQEGRGRPEGPSRGLESRYLAIARCHALGLTTNQIARRFNLSASRISLIVKTDFVQTEIRKYRDRLFDQDLASAMKDMGPDALRVMNLMLNGEGEKLKDRVEASKWLLEKLTGKPKQEINVESGTINAFMDLLKGMQDRGEKLDVLDVTPRRSEATEGLVESRTEEDRGGLVVAAPQQTPTEPEFSSWIAEHLRK